MAPSCGSRFSRTSSDNWTMAIRTRSLVPTSIVGPITEGLNSGVPQSVRQYLPMPRPDSSEKGHSWQYGLVQSECSRGRLLPTDPLHLPCSWQHCGTHSFIARAPKHVGLGIKVRGALHRERGEDVHFASWRPRPRHVASPL